MKKKLSFLMVLMMMVSLVPANMAFAASDSVVNTVVTSSDGTVDFDLDIELKGAGVTSGGIFEITLGDDAEWVGVPTVSFSLLPVGLVTLTNPATVGGEQRAEFKINDDATTGNIRISGEVKLDGAEEGDQKVTIENITNSGISRQVLTYAVISGSGNIVSRRLGDLETVTRGTKFASDFELRETTKNAMSNGTFVLRLPKDVEWASGTTVKLNGTAALEVSTFGDRELTVTVAGAMSSVIDRIIVKPEITMTKDAKFTDIEVEVMDKTADIDADDVKIAEYKDFGIELVVDEVQSIVAGKADTSKDYVVEVTLETAGNSFIDGRPIDFTVSGGDVKLKGTNPATSRFDNIDVDYDDEFEISLDGYTSGNDLEFELYLKADWDATGELTITAEGAGVDEQTIKLADVLSAAKVTTKVDGNKTIADVVVGLQDQMAPEITISETEEGSLQEGFYVLDLNEARYDGVDFIDSSVKFETDGDISVDDVYTIEGGEKLVIEVDGESNKEASSITITGLGVTLDRSVPFGQLDLRFGAVVADGDQTNPTADDGEFGLDPEEKSFDYEVETIVENIPFLNVVTEVQTAKQQKTVFSIDSATYTVGSETKTLDAAPYISNNRTMLPIGTVAQLAGATLNYSPSTRTAIFTKDNLVVSMNLDTNMLLVNGSPVPMDAKPEIVNGRAFVSVVFVAQAFGIQNGTDIVYDAASRTVTLFPSAQ